MNRIWPPIHRFATKLGFPRFLALILLCTFLVHRSISRYMSHRPWMLAPIAVVERKCPAPSYQTISQSQQTDKAGKICLTTLTDEKQKSMATKFLGWRNFDGLLELTWKNKQDYADKHGYHLYNESDMLDKSRPPSWSKIRATQRLLQEENCTWVFWLDADTVIMNSEIRIQDFLPSDPTKDLLLSVDTGGGYNAGVWLVHNTWWGRNFLDTWWNMKAFVKPVGLSHSGDNDALKAFMQNLPEEVILQHVLAPARCTFNSFIKVVAPNDYEQVLTDLHQQDFYLAEAYYHKGDFIAHVAGVDNKVDTLKMLLEAAE
jgi:mannan polymerase II complex MNN10 subunit